MITDEDRKAAAAYLYRDDENGYQHEALADPNSDASFERTMLLFGESDDHPLVQAFARHREAAEARIVAWLRTWENLTALAIANDIEAGEHREETTP